MIKPSESIWVATCVAVGAIRISWRRCDPSAGMANRDWRFRFAISDSGVAIGGWGNYTNSMQVCEEYKGHI
jgi:hypothetical protein